MIRGLTDAQYRNLEHVRDHGRPTPGSVAAYHCRRKKLSEFLWLFQDGKVSAVSEKEPVEGNELVRVIGEQLTTAGRAALAEHRSRAK